MHGGGGIMQRAEREPNVAVPQATKIAGETALKELLK